MTFTLVSLPFAVVKSAMQATEVAMYILIGLVPVIAGSVIHAINRAEWATDRLHETMRQKVKARAVANAVKLPQRA